MESENCSIAIVLVESYLQVPRTFVQRWKHSRRSRPSRLSSIKTGGLRITNGDGFLFLTLDEISKQATMLGIEHNLGRPFGSGQLNHPLRSHSANVIHGEGLGGSFGRAWAKWTDMTLSLSMSIRCLATLVNTRCSFHVLLNFSSISKNDSRWLMNLAGNRVSFL